MHSKACFGFTGLLLFGAGCDEAEVRSYVVPKSPTIVTVQPPAPTGDPRVRWTTPTGWTEDPTPSAMRLASFSFEGGGDVSLTFLLGGGEPLENINRWRGQIKLPPVNSLDEQPMSRLDVQGQPAGIVDLAGEQSRIVAAMLPRSGGSWFVKMTGPPDVLEKHKGNFADFVASLRFQEQP